VTGGGTRPSGDDASLAGAPGTRLSGDDASLAGAPGARPSDIRRVATASAWGIAGRAAVLALGLVSVAVGTRYLGPSAYGRMTLAFSITQLFAVVADAGLTTTAVRELAQRPERAPVVVGSVLVLRSALALAAVVAAALLALALPYPDQVRVAVLIAGVPLALGLLNSGWVAVLQADLRASRIASAAARRSPETSVRSDASIATSVPVPIASPRSACASAGASLTPSPTIATRCPAACRRAISATFSSG
jgi:hypothetical protein